MATYTIQAYKRIWTKRAKSIRNVAIKTANQAATYMLYQARSMAPVDSGQTLMGLRMHRTGSGKSIQYTVESTVPGAFKQNLFANQTAPYRTLHFKKKNPVYAYPQNVVYGQPAVSKYKKPIHWTGTPRFFHLATLRTKDRFRQLVRVNTAKALRVRI